MSALEQFLAAAAGLFLDAGVWVIGGLLAAGLVREFLGTGRMGRFLRQRGRRSLGAALALGALLPVCSCGVVPLAVGFHLAGVRLAAVVTFIVATPVINPAAVVLAYALMGPELTLAYVAFGLTVPLAVGLLAERVARPGLTNVAAQLHCCGGARPADETALPPGARLRRAVHWAFVDLGLTLGRYLGIGVLLAALVATLLPPDAIARHLGADAPWYALPLVALLGGVIYVCAVAHIPLVASLLAAGAGPGAAIVFLVTGAATNLPELIALQRVLGGRTIAVYVVALLGASLAAGWALNAALPGYTPTLDPLQALALGDLASRLTPGLPLALAAAGAVALAALSLLGLLQGLLQWVLPAQAAATRGNA